MTAADFGMALLLLQIPVTFWAVLSGGPAAHVLVPWIDHAGETKAAVFSAPLQVPCLALAVLLVYTGIQSRKWQEEVGDSATLFDYTADDGLSAPGNVLFWIAALSFTWVKAFLLMHYIDCFALILTALLSSVALFVSCRPVDRDLIGYRITGIVAFVLALLPMVALAMEYAQATEVYVLALCVCADGLLVIGHTWDFPACPLSTVINCRVAYLMLLQAALPLSICASCELF